MERIKIDGKTQAQLNVERVTETKEQEREKARAYLRDTMEIIVEALELGKPIPDDVQQKRASARLTIATIREAPDGKN